MTQRYVRNDRRVYHDALCKLCGTMWGGFPDHQCRDSTCMTCGSRQCQVNGLGRGQCAICYVGLLPGWSGTDKPCRYKDCQHKAVAVDGAWPVCAEHLERRKPGYVAECIANRGKGWMLVDELMSGTARVA